MLHLPHFKCSPKKLRLRWCPTEQKQTTYYNKKFKNKNNYALQKDRGGSGEIYVVQHERGLAYLIVQMF